MYDIALSSTGNSRLGTLELFLYCTETALKNDIAFLIGPLHARGILVRVNGIEGYSVKIEGLEDDGLRTPIILNRVRTGLQRPLEPLSRAKATLI